MDKKLVKYLRNDIRALLKRHPTRRGPFVITDEEIKEAIASFDTAPTPPKPE